MDDVTLLDGATRPLTPRLFRKFIEDTRRRSGKHLAPPTSLVHHTVYRFVKKHPTCPRCGDEWAVGAYTIACLKCNRYARPDAYPGLVTDGG